MSEPEVIVNLWFVIDAGTGYVYTLSGRAYVASGTDAEKLALLKLLAPTDYLMSKQVRVPDNFVVITGDEERKGYMHPQDIGEHKGILFEQVFKLLESEIPERLQFIAGEPVRQKMTMPQDPLCVCTALVEDEDGNLNLVPR